MGRVFIIAEAGINHNGDLALAKKLADAAARAGADAVKFQTFISEKVVSKSAGLAGYQADGKKGRGSQLDLIKKYELSFGQFKKLKDHCDRIGIKFMTTPDDFESADFADTLVDVFKIGSGEVTNTPFLRHIAAKGKPVILSTGMATLAETRAAAREISAARPKKMRGAKFPPLTLLHCVSNYPAAFEDLNLPAMLSLRKALRLPVGLSDHTLGIEASVAAAALGATVIEKHFTLDKKMSGPDHKASLSPEELKAMVSAIRNIEKTMGDGVKRPVKGELEMIRLVRKSLVAARDIRAGERLSPDMVELKRPGGGIQPRDLKKAVGKRFAKAVRADEVVHWKHLRK